MTSTERIRAVLSDHYPDRPPFGFWHHFQEHETFGPAAIEAHLRHYHRYHVDFLKIMNDTAYPQHTISSAQELGHIQVRNGDEDGFGRQLKLIAALRETLPDTLLVSTVFNAFAILRALVHPDSSHLPPNLNAPADGTSHQLRSFYKQDPAGFRHAINAIGDSLAHFAAKCIEAGADGIFLSVRDDWVESVYPGLYDSIIHATDLKILAAAHRGTFNILHVCGRAESFERFIRYPVHAINWADRATGPAIRDVAASLRPTICAGIDNLATLATGTPEDVERQVEDALRQAGQRPIIIAPGCTFDPVRVPPENLDAIERAVSRWHYPGIQ